MILFEKAFFLLKKKRYLLLFFSSSIFYLLLSLILIRYFYVGFDQFFSTGILAYFNLAITLLISLLFGINMIFVVYTFSNLRRYSNQAGVGVFSFVISIFIAGCPACSLTLLSLIVPYIGAAISLSLFTLKGLEIQLVGIALLIISLFFTSRDLECR